MNRITTASLALLLLAGPAFAEDPQQDVGRYSPQTAQEPAPGSVNPIGEVSTDVADLTPGDHAPDFRLESSLGTIVTRADIEGHYSVLVFNTDSAPFSQFSAENDSLLTMGVWQYGICQDEKKPLGEYAANHKLKFLLLSDPNADIAKLFGMYDTDNQAIQPGIVVLDEKGIVRAVVQGSMLPPDAVLTMVRHTLPHP